MCVVCYDRELAMSFVRLTIKGKDCYLRACSVQAILPDEKRKDGCVIYCDPPVEALSVDESVEDVFTMVYTEETDDEDEEDYGDYDDMLLSYFNQGKEHLVPKQ